MSTLEGRAFLTHAADRRRLLWAGGTVFDVIIGGAQSGGVVSLLDQWGRRGDVAPLHIHNSEAEIFYVLEGGITAWVGRATRHPDRRAASGNAGVGNADPHRRTRPLMPRWRRAVRPGHGSRAGVPA
jgi:hypothetical protein